MWKDPIVEETRQLRKQYLEKCGNSSEALFADIVRRQKQPEEHTVALPSRPVRRIRKSA